MGRLSGVMADLERDRMTQANEVVRLRDIVAECDKETQASEVARLEHDRMAQVNEVVRLREVTGA